MDKQILFSGLCLCLVVIISAVTASEGPDAPVTKPPQYAQSNCYEYQVKMLNAATVVGDPDQDSYLKAAQAYQRLDELGQAC